MIYLKSWVILSNRYTFISNSNVDGNDSNSKKCFFDPMISTIKQSLYRDINQYLRSKYMCAYMPYY